MRTWANLIAFAACVALATLAAWSPNRGVAPSNAAPAIADIVRRTTLPDGRAAILDAADVAVPISPYRRIATLSIVADALACELCEGERWLAASAWSADKRWAFHAGARPRVPGLDDLEALLALTPDLVVVSQGDVARVARLRERGVTVLDLGPSRGVDSYLASARVFAAAIGIDERGERYATAFARRMHAIAAAATGPRPRGIYLSLMGGRLFGGTRGTSYGDVLAAAGLDDIAAARWRDWPMYTGEDVLALAPEILVVPSGQAAELRRLPGLAALPAFARPDSVIEVDAATLEDPGPGMLDAAEAVRAQLRSHAPARR